MVVIYAYVFVLLGTTLVWLGFSPRPSTFDHNTWWHLLLCATAGFIMATIILKARRQSGKRTTRAYRLLAILIGIVASGLVVNSWTMSERLEPLASEFRQIVRTHDPAPVKITSSFGDEATVLDYGGALDKIKAERQQYLRQHHYRAAFTQWYAGGYPPEATTWGIYFWSPL